MAQASVFDQGIDRVQSTLKDLDREMQRVRRELSKRRRSLTRDLRSRRQSLERRAERQLRRLRTELRRNPAYKRAEALQADARRRVERQVDQLLGAFPLASKNEIESLERKVTRLTRRVRELEKTNGIAESA
jgi:ABC-type transporter Mla subunit MlaD